MIDTLLDNLGLSDGAETLPDIDQNVEGGIGESATDSSISVSDSINMVSQIQQAPLVDNSLSIDETLSLSTGEHVTEVSDVGSPENPENINIQFPKAEFASLESSTNEVINAPLSMDGQLSTIPVSGESTIDVDSLINTPTTDSLDISNDDIDKLQEKAEGIERKEHRQEISFGKKMCPTRHGCQGATDCDYSYGGYPG